MKGLLPLLCFLLSSCLIFGQETSKRTYRKFATQQVHERLLKEHPEFSGNQHSIEEWVYKYSSQSAGQEKFTIPVVFHIITFEGKKPIDAIQIQSQLAALNRDFGNRKLSASHPADIAAGFLERTAKMDVDFCLPKSSPSGQITTGITYTNTTLTGWSTANGMKFSGDKGVDAWDPDRYLNVWVVDMNKDVAGYAQMPGGPKVTDGIVIDPDYFGIGSGLTQPYSEGKTLTHLVGSYLGLYELWDYKGRCRDDRVADTPIHNSPNVGCKTHNHLSFCAGEMTEMLMNFMDNSDDPCMDMFTEGQKQRVMAMLGPGGPRHNLVAGSKTQCEFLEAFLSDEPLGMQISDTESKATSVQLYPNPVKNTLQIDLLSSVPIEDYQCTIISAIGQTMIELDLGPTISGQINHQLNVSQWPSGLYYFKLDSGQEILTKSFVIQQ